MTKEHKVIESNAKNPELNKVISPLNIVQSYDEQLTEVRKKISWQILLQLINKFYPIILFQKVHVSLLDCWRLNVGWNRQKLINNWKTQSQCKILPRCSYRRHVRLYEATTSEVTRLHHFAYWNK